MRIEIKTKHYVGIIFGALIIILDFIFFFNFTGEIGPKWWWFNPLIVLGIIVAIILFIIDFLNIENKEKEIEQKFLEFVRSLVENVRSGVSIPQAILHVENSNYGTLTPYVQKLAHQIEWGYPLKTALEVFANDTKNSVIKRAIAIVIEAEKSGGDIGAVLEAVGGSVVEIKKVKEERKANANSQTIQGYIIYAVFIGVMVMLQVFLIPKISTLSADVNAGLGAGLGGLGGGTAEAIDFGPIFMTLIMIQGLFAGLMIGKFAEGEYKEGIKHSIIMMMGGYFITATLTGIFAPEEALLAVIPLITTRGLICKKGISRHIKLTKEDFDKLPLDNNGDNNV